MDSKLNNYGSLVLEYVFVWYVQSSARVNKSIQAK